MPSIPDLLRQTAADVEAGAFGDCVDAAVIIIATPERVAGVLGGGDCDTPLKCAGMAFAGAQQVLRLKE